jgi:hypothetical protein
MVRALRFVLSINYRSTRDPRSWSLARRASRWANNGGWRTSYLLYVRMRKPVAHFGRVHNTYATVNHRECKQRGVDGGTLVALHRYDKVVCTEQHVIKCLLFGESAKTFVIKSRVGHRDGSPKPSVVVRTLTRLEK